MLVISLFGVEGIRYKSKPIFLGPRPIRKRTPKGTTAANLKKLNRYWAFFRTAPQLET